MAEQAARIVLDVEALTLGDLEDFEEFVGKDLFQVIPTTPEEAAKFKPSAKVLTAIVWLVQRGTNPEFTVDDARRMKVGELDFAFGSAQDPTPAAG